MTTHIQIGDTRPRVQYQGDGLQTVFPYPFALFRDADLTVFLDDDAVTGGFSVSGAGVSDGGAVTFASAPAAGQRVTLLRRLAIARATDFQAGGALRAAALNDELDHLTAVDQQLDEALSRAVTVPPTAPDAVAAVLPQPRPGAVIGWNETATALVNDPQNYAGLSEALATIHAAAGAGAVALGHATQAMHAAQDAALSSWLVDVVDTGAGSALSSAVAAATEATEAVRRAERWAEDAALSAWCAAQEGGIRALAEVDHARLGAAAVLHPSQVAGLFEAVHAASATLTTLPLRRCERATAALTLTLPPAIDCPPGWHRHISARGGAVTLAAQGGDTLGGAASLALTQGQTALIVRTGRASFERY